MQTWIRPDEPGTPPSWRAERVPHAWGVTTVVGADGLGIGTRGASLHIVRLEPGTSLQLPHSARQHVFVALGARRLNDEAVEDGDAVRLTDQPEVEFVATTDTDLLVWSFPPK